MGAELLLLTVSLLAALSWMFAESQGDDLVDVTDPDAPSGGGSKPPEPDFDADGTVDDTDADPDPPGTPDPPAAPDPKPDPDPPTDPDPKPDAPGTTDKAGDDGEGKDGEAKPGNFDKGLANLQRKQADYERRVQAAEERAAAAEQRAERIEQLVTDLKAGKPVDVKDATDADSAEGQASDATSTLGELIDQVRQSGDQDQIVDRETLIGVLEQLDKQLSSSSAKAPALSEQQTKALEMATSLAQREQRESARAEYAAAFDAENEALKGQGLELLDAAMAAVSQEYPELDQASETYARLVDKDVASRIEAAASTSSSPPKGKTPPKQPSRTSPDSSEGASIRTRGASATAPPATRDLPDYIDPETGEPDFDSDGGE